MRTLIRRSPKPAKADPAPSRWAWRMQRLMLTPGFRLALRAGVPFGLAMLIGTIYLSDESRRGAIIQVIEDTRTSIQDRPEFMVELMAIDGAEDALALQIREAVPLDLPKSSFKLDLPQIRATITALHGVRQASVRVRPGGVLQVDVTPRVPAAIWRRTEGLALIDESGAHVRDVGSRLDHPELPLIAGRGASRHVPEALQLMRAAAPLGSRLRGVVRIGERRWDVVLDREQRIMLPEADPVQALERVIALEGAQEVLSRDVAAVDMRLASRPTVRMNEEATREWWHIRQLSGQ
ncbi:cell division protein FtsQ/DivIB [Sulfitobacter aestuarii]|uniref:Cell division protein FtsQ n=1 Tax=Sulfitobacter aestuarii TaxID=2161676 RepID=A0ABW5U0S3_9RHOB